MPFPLAAAILGGSLVSGLFGSRSSDRAADAQTAASQAAIDEQRRQYDQTRADLAPYQYGGGQAFNDILGEFGYQPYKAPQPQTFTGQPLRIMGADIPGLTTAPPPSGPQGMNIPAPNIGFKASPDYAFRRSEGNRDINNTFAAKGGALSGNALRALTEYNSNLASSEYGNWFNRRAAVAGIGQTATNASGQFGAQTAGNIGNALMNQGNARASGITGSASAINNAVQGGISNYLLYRNL